MTATFWLTEKTSFWFQRADHANKQGILCLGEELDFYGSLEDFERLGKALLSGVEALRKKDKPISYLLKEKG